MSDIMSWCECFPLFLLPEPNIPGSKIEGMHADVLTASPTRPDDQYYVRRVVGTGATGTALIGRRVRDNLPIIAKVVELGDLDDSQKERTNSEIECLARCRHSMIIQYLAHYIVDSRLLVVMELADAGDLGFQIKHRREAKAYFLEQEVALMLTQILIAVDYIHSNGILHRDLKPANVFVKTNGLVKIGDFGLSRIFEETVSRDVANSLVGTPYYLAPEVWKREKYGKKVDMFSIGVLWYEMITLERPFKGSSVTAVMQAITEGNPPQLPPYVSDDTQRIVSRLLALDPAKRFSVVELFETPLMDHALRIFSTTIIPSLPASEAAKASVQRDALVLRAKVQAHIEAKFPVTLPSADRMSALQFAAPMVHLEDGKKWKHRALRLTDDGTLQIAKSMDALNGSNSATAGGSGGDGAVLSASQSSVGGASSSCASAASGKTTPANVVRNIPISDVFMVNTVPQCFAEGRPNVFAIVLRSSDEGLWFYSAIDADINTEWRRRLSEACGRDVTRMPLEAAPEE